MGKHWEEYLFQPKTIYLKEPPCVVFNNIKTLKESLKYRNVKYIVTDILAANNVWLDVITTYTSLPLWHYFLFALFCPC